MLKMTTSNKVLFSTTSITRLARNMAFAFTGLIAASAPAFAIDSNALPTGGTVASGSADINYNGNNLNVNQGSQRVIIDWNSFNIGENAATYFNQPNAAALAVNRVHDVDPSQILGALHANGQVIILNTNGVIFGKNAKVDVAGLLVSTGEINADKFMSSGQIELSKINANNGKIINNGQISVKEGGLAAFVAPQFENNGVIEANLGKIAIAGGADKATVDMYGDGLVELALDDKASKAVITNNGTLRANGGKIAITVKAAQGIVDSTINMNGVVEANSFHQKNGVISLDATNADIKVAGKVSARGGKIAAHTNKNIQVADTAVLDASADSIGNGGIITVVAEGKTDFAGALYARGGDQSGDGGSAEISGKEALGFSGYANLGSDNGTIGTLTLDPNWAIIHSGIAGGSSGYLISAQALANALATSNVVVQADQFIDVGAAASYGSTILNALAGAILGQGNIDLSHYNYTNLEQTGTIHTPIGNIPTYGLVNHQGTTAGTITLQSNTVNFNKDTKLGTGDLNVQASTINLNGKLSDVAGLLKQTDIASTANTVNVISNAALIQQGVYLAAANGTVNVGDGTYTENVTISKALKLLSKNGRAATTIDGVQAGNEQGTVYITSGTDNVQVGDVGKGFTIKGLNGNGASEKAGVYIQGSNSGTKVIGNEIVAQGDEGLLTEYSAVINNLKIDNNIFSGKTFTGANPSGVGSSTQFDVGNNVPRQLVVVGGGLDGGNTSNVTFTNNQVTGTAGGLNGSGQEQGNMLVTISSKTSTITGNSFTGTTARYGAALRVRGKDATVTGNTINATGLIGIDVDGVDTATIGNNSVTGTKVGILTEDAAKNITINNNNNIHDVVVGIDVEGGSNNTVAGNTISKTSGDGIDVNGSTGATVKGNSVTTAGGYGIRAVNSNGVTIGGTAVADGNTVTGITLDGIQVAGTDAAHLVTGATIENNIVSDTGRVGIYSAYTSALQIIKNTVSAMHLAGYGAISTDWGQDYNIAGNTVSGSDQGIRMYDANGKNAINSNIIDNVTGDGIHTEATQNLYIYNNLLGFTGTIGGNGIYANGLDSSAGLNTVGSATGIYNNQINNAGANGIDVVNASGSQANGTVDVGFNQTLNTATNGILIDGGSMVSAYFNTLTKAGVSGIEAQNTHNDNINFNTIDGGNVSIDSGIRLDNANALTLNTNTIKNTLIDGIRAFGSYALHATGNIISHVAGSGIGLAGSDYATIDGNNQISNAGRGVWVGNSDHATIDNNTIKDSTTYGVFLTNYGGSSDNAVITSNTITGGEYGVYIEGGADQTTVGGTSAALGNTIKNASIAGIHIDNSNNLTAQYNTITGNAADGTTDDTGIDVYTSANIKLQDNTINNESYAIFLDGNGVATNGQIVHNTITGADGQAIHTRDNAYADILNNIISNSAVGIVTENFSAANPTGHTTKIDGNTISVSKIGIRNNLSYGDQSGFVISNNTITAENPSEARRWTGIDVISQMGGVATLFKGNDIDGSAVNASRQTAGYELTNITNTGTVINGGNVKNVDVGVWATDSSVYSGAVTDLLVKNVHFKNIGEEAILVEDVAGDATATHITIGAGNTFQNTNYDLALAGAHATAGLDGTFAGVQKTLVKAAGPQHYTLGGLTTDNASINSGIFATAPGGTVKVEAGTFSEAVLANKGVTIVGSGSNATIIDGTGIGGTGIDISAGDVTLRNLVVKNWLNGLAVNNSITNLSINNVTSSNNYYTGFLVSNSGSIDGLTVLSSHFDNNDDVPNPGDNDFGYGWYFSKNDNNVANTTNVKNVTVTDTTFNGNAQKGIYAEKLSDATFTNVHVEDTGHYATSLFGNIGIDINLKNGVYQNIVFDNLTMKNTGNDSTLKNGTAITVKARNDGGTYSLTPATLTGLVIENSHINTPGTNGISIGNNVVDAKIADNHVKAKQAITVYGGASTTDIYGNTITGAALYGIGVADSTVNIHDNTITNTTGTGKAIVLYDANNSVVGSATDPLQGNTIKGSAVGIEVDATTGSVIVANNNISGTSAQGILGQSDAALVIEHNTIHKAGTDGISISQSNGAIITDNDIIKAGGYGIYSLSSSNVMVGGTDPVDGNTIKTVTLDGIKFDGGDSNTAQYNLVDGSTRVGIYAANNTNLKILDNTIKNELLAGYGAISTDWGSNLTFSGNTITSSVEGIHMMNAGGTNVISGNHIDNVTSYGINAQGDNLLTVDGNKIGLKHNSTIGGDGIYVAGAATGSSITDNRIKHTSGDGIDLVSSNGVLVQSNRIKSVAGDAIHVDGGAHNSILKNIIRAITGNGISAVNNSDFAEISNNNIKHVSGNGIDVDGGKSVAINDNHIDDAVEGIAVSNLKGHSYINRNVIDNVTSDAIHAENTKRLTVNNNKIGLKANSTIGGAGIYADGVTTGRFANNKIANAANDGIFINDIDQAIVRHNTITKAGGNGIELSNATLATLDNNTVNDNSKYGLFIAPGTSGTFTLTNNHIQSLAAGSGAYFGDGAIDLQGATNTFDGGVDGLVFSGTTVSLVGNTFGTTEFTNQSGYYIRLADHALFNPDAPTHLDARQSSFDGFVPTTYLLSFNDYQTLTAKLFDFGDDSSLGWIFFNYPVTDINDILPKQNLAFSGGTNGASVTILGLPYASRSFFGTNAAFNAGIFNLRTAAGPNQKVASNTAPYNAKSLNDIATAAGGANDSIGTNNANPADLNNIETASGGNTEKAACWGQVYSHFAASASAVTFDLGGSPAAMLNSEASCK